MKTYRISKFTTLALLVALGLSLGAYTAFAAANSFTIGLSVVTDSTPPSTPTGLVATTISSSQIGLSWTASTGNDCNAATDNIPSDCNVVSRGSP